MSNIVNLRNEITELETKLFEESSFEKRIDISEQFLLNRLKKNKNI